MSIPSWEARLTKPGLDVESPTALQRQLAQTTSELRSHHQSLLEREKALDEKARRFRAREEELEKELNRLYVLVQTQKELIDQHKGLIEQQQENRRNVMTKVALDLEKERLRLLEEQLIERERALDAREMAAARRDEELSIRELAVLAAEKKGEENASQNERDTPPKEKVKLLDQDVLNERQQLSSPNGSHPASPLTLSNLKQKKNYEGPTGESPVHVKSYVEVLSDSDKEEEAAKKDKTASSSRFRSRPGKEESLVTANDCDGELDESATEKLNSFIKRGVLDAYTIAMMQFQGYSLREIVELAEQEDELDMEGHEECDGDDR